ncbi:MAG: hydrogenase expression/formation protein HypE [Candidatus Bipolaricaulota bacterium]
MSAAQVRVSSLHGAGGEVMDDLIRSLIVPRFAARSAGRIGLSAMDDGATIERPATGELVVTTDCHVVKPVFFPGGDIGRLAAAGTVNDLAVMGARPVAFTLGIILEEGFALEDLEKILDSFAEVLAEVDASLVGGDTKVMASGDVDGIILCATGFGIADRAVSDAELWEGDDVLITGTVGDHGMALLAAREEFRLSTRLVSDVAPLWSLLKPVLPMGVHAMKDPTRGGLAAALNEMARKSEACVEIDEASIPLRAEVAGLSDLLGISPLDVANEGKAVLVVDPQATGAILAALAAHPRGAQARRIGKVTRRYPGRVVMDTGIGGERFLDMPLGDPVPRIC